MCVLLDFVQKKYELIRFELNTRFGYVLITVCECTKNFESWQNKKKNEKKSV